MKGIRRIYQLDSRLMAFSGLRHLSHPSPVKQTVGRHLAQRRNMGNMKFWWIFGFEWWGGLMPAEMTTAKGVRYVPLVLGLWIKRPTKRTL